VAYTVQVTREGKWWALSFPELGDDAVTQARRLAEVEREARDYLAVTLDVAFSTVDVEVVIDNAHLPPNVQQRSEQLLNKRAQIAVMQEEVAKDSAELARELAAESVPVRDIATLIGTSFQRVSQLIDA
jgi:hypothetical protein